MVNSHPANQVSDKLLALGNHGDDPEIMSEQRQRQRGNSCSTMDSCCNSRESLVEIMLRRHTGLLERHLHNRRIVPQRIKFAAGEIRRWEVLMVVLGQDRESVGVVGVGVGIPIQRKVRTRQLFLIKSSDRAMWSLFYLLTCRKSPCSPYQ